MRDNPTPLSWPWTSPKKHFEACPQMQDLEVAQFLVTSWPLFLWRLRKPSVTWVLAREITALSSSWLEEDREFRDRWPWETDVLTRMALDKKARVAAASSTHG